MIIVLPRIVLLRVPDEDNTANDTLQDVQRTIALMERAQGEWLFTAARKLDEQLHTLVHPAVQHHVNELLLPPIFKEPL